MKYEIKKIFFTTFIFILFAFLIVILSRQVHKSHAQSSPYPTLTPTPSNTIGNIYTHPSFSLRGLVPSQNPKLGDLCGLDIALAMDISSSISKSTELPKEKAAIRNFIEAFKGTNTRFSLTTFYKHAKLQSPLTSDFDSVIAKVNSISDTHSGTNWYEAITTATSSGKPKLIVIFSDGDPTDPGTDNFATSKAVEAANLAKSHGIRILAVGISNAVNGATGLKKMLLISGLNELRTTSNDYSLNDISMADYISTSFNSMQEVLNKFALAACPRNRISPSPSPSPYPTIVIRGSLKKDDSTSTTSCSQSFDYPQGIAPATPGISLLPRDPNATVSCNTLRPGDTTYTCNLSLKNQVNPSISPARTVVLSSGWYPGGSDTYWLGSCSAASCQQSTICNSHNNRFSVNFSQTNPVYNRDMIFPIRDNWFKLKDTSFNSVGPAVRNNIIPPTVSAYDNIDDTTEPYLITGEGGLVTTKQNPINTGATNNRYSNNNWPLRDYDIKNKFEDVSTYINYYIKQKADYRPITSVSQIDPDDHKKIYYLNRDLTIDSNNVSHFNRENLILIVDGEVDFALGTGATFAPTKSIAIIAKSIMFYKKTSASTTNTNQSGLIKSAKGIFIADTIDLGGSIDIPIKIKGNLVALTDRVGNSRKQTDTTKPSIFVVFDPKIYLDIIFNIGVQIYN